MAFAMAQIGIRVKHQYEIMESVLIVNGYSNPLPIKWEDRREKYHKAYEIFG